MKKKRTTLILAIVIHCLMFGMIGCGGRDTLPKDILGAWVRMDDRYEGMIIQFSRDDKEGTVGSLVYVTNEIRSGGFDFGDQKIKGIERIAADEYECESLVKTADHGVVSNEWYERDIIYIRAGTELILRQKEGNDMKVGEWQRWIRLNDAPGHQGNYHFGKGILAEREKDFKKAVKHYDAAVEKDNEDSRFQNAIAWSLATAEDKSVLNGQKALQHAEKACQLTKFDEPLYLDTLAAAHARAGNFDRAVEFQSKACMQYQSPPDEFLGRLALYRNKKSYTQGRKLPEYKGPAPTPVRTSGNSPL